MDQDQFPQKYQQFEVGELQKYDEFSIKSCTEKGFSEKRFCFGLV